MAGQLLRARMNFVVEALGGGDAGGVAGGAIRYRQRSKRLGGSPVRDDPPLRQSSTITGQGWRAQGCSQRIHAEENHAIQWLPTTDAMG